MYPNVDFYSGVIYKATGFPPEYFTVLFALPRFAGWLAHWNEFIQDPDNKIVRPRQIYKGERGRNYVPIDQRQPEDLAEYLTDYHGSHHLALIQEHSVESEGSNAEPGSQIRNPSRKARQAGPKLVPEASRLAGLSNA